MKNISRIIVTISLLMVSLSTLFADTPPDPGGGPGGGDLPVGGGAPIGGGLFIMLVLGTVYGVKKFFHNRNKIME